MKLIEAMEKAQYMYELICEVDVPDSQVLKMAQLMVRADEVGLIIGFDESMGWAIMNNANMTIISSCEHWNELVKLINAIETYSKMMAA